MEYQKKDEINLINENENNQISQEYEGLKETTMNQLSKQITCGNCGKLCKNEALEICGTCKNNLCIECLDSNLKCLVCTKLNNQIQQSIMEKNDEFLSNKRDNLCLEDNDKKNNFSKKKSRLKKISPYCHHCDKKRSNTIKCSKIGCKKYFCKECLNRIYKDSVNDENLESWKCFHCKELCKSIKCKQLTETNLILNGKNNQQYSNTVKIDNFLILEKESSSDLDSRVSQNSEIKSFRKINMEKLCDIEKKKIKDAIINVFSDRLTIKLCLICDKYINNDDTNEILKFKTLEDFLFFNKFYLQPNQNYFNLENVNCKGNIQSFDDQYKIHQKYHKNDYIFKSVKYICKLCFQTKLNKENGFYELFNSLHISNPILNSCNFPQKGTNSPEISKQNLQNIKALIEDLNPKNDKNINVTIDKQYNIVIRKEVLKTEDTNSNLYNNLLDITGRFTLNQKNNIPVSTQMEMNLQKSKNNENLLLNLMKNQNFSKNLNPNTYLPIASTLSYNIQSVSSEINNPAHVHSQTKLNELGKIIDLAMQYENSAQSKNNQVLNSLANASNLLVEEIERKSDDILNNSQKKKEFLDKFYNYFEEIKKQIFSMQQNNNTQSNLISLIFKNLENFFGQVSGNFNSRINSSISHDLNSMIPNKLNDINITPNLFNSLPVNPMISLGNNKIGFNEQQYPQLSLNQINNSFFPMGLDQYPLNNNIGMSNSNQIFQNNLNLFPPINHTFTSNGIGMMQNIPNNFLVGPLINPSFLRNSGQFPANPLVSNPLNTLYTNPNPNNTKI